jgi:type IV pilus assembly protein PilQ
MSLEHNFKRDRARSHAFGFIVWLLMTSLTLALPATAFAASNVLQDISVSSLPGNIVEITLTAQDPVPLPNSFATESPARIAIDLPGMKSALAKKTQSVGIGMVRSITAVEAGDRTRVVINLADAVAHEVKVSGNQVTVQVNAGSAQVAAAKSVSTTNASNQAELLPATSSKGIKNIDFRRGSDGEGRVLITLNDPSIVADLREEGGKVLLDFIDTSLPERFMRKFDVSDFATPVNMFEITAKDNNVHVEITPTGDYEHLAYQANDLFAIEFRSLTKSEKEKLQKERLVYSGERLSLNFQQIEVRAVLQLLADFTNLNLVTSDSVTGSITLRLQNVPWDQALDIILKAKGLSMRKNNNVVMVAPTEEIAAREKLELESQQQIEELAPLRSEYIQINYAKASDIAALLRTEGNQLITPERGNVTVDERTNTLLVRDTLAKLDDIQRLIKKLDVPVRQVLIESRVVIANDDFAKDIGVQFGFDQSYSEKIDGNEIMIAGGLEGDLVDNYDAGTFMGAGVGLKSTGDDATRNLLVNLPQTLSASRGGAVNLLVGKIGSFLLQLELSAMQQEGKGEIISSPRVITADRNTATIKQGVEIPYQEASSSGATTVSFKEAVLQLEVTPQITPDDRVIMDLTINKDSADFSRSVLGVPPVDTREINTSVLIDNGETVVLGGVFERTRSKSMERVPFFGDLPYVGFLFKQEAEQDQNTELLIFVTPKILKETIGMR